MRLLKRQVRSKHTGGVKHSFLIDNSFNTFGYSTFTPFLSSVYWCEQGFARKIFANTLSILLKVHSTETQKGFFSSISQI